MHKETLAQELQRIEPRVATSPWPDHEYLRGFAAMGLSFSSGHMLELRVTPQNDFAPYVSVWHRTPEGEWITFSDGPCLETMCPRYWGPATRHREFASIDLDWIGPTTLRVEMEKPRLVWTMSITETPVLKTMNPITASLPLWTWKPASLLRVREWMAKTLLGMGDMHFSFTMPSGHAAVIMPERIFFIEASEAVLDGQSLGELVRLEANPTIGRVRLPARPTFTIAQAHMRIKDYEEYWRTREEVRGGLDLRS